jgi:beta-lactamase class A
VRSMLVVNTDSALLMRSIPRDTVEFFHKTGSMTGVLHDWGFTDDCELFLLTQNVTNEPVVFEVFGALGSQCLITTGI